jgi:hypothetical protein
MSNSRQTGHRWLLEWVDDSGDSDRDIRETADSVEEARDAVRRILTGATWTPEGAREFGGDQTEPAYTALVREAFGGDVVAGLLGLRDGGLTFRCDDGTLTISRER